jgi:hypothetical protein
MNANFSLPVLTSTYANFLAEMKSRDEDIAIWFEGTTSTNIPAGTKKWNSTGNKFEKWNGTDWSDLSTLYEIKVRDSDKLNGQAASYYSAANHVHNAVTTTVNGFMSYTDKVKLDAIAVNANNYSHPAGDGNLHVPANGTSNSGKYLQATSTSGVYTWASLPASSLSTLGITATAAELNKLDGVTATATHLNYINTLSSNAQTQLNAKAPLASPALSGAPTAPTAAAGTNTTQLATTAFVLANSDVVSSTTVGTANAGLALGAVGTYAFMLDVRGLAGSIAAGATLAGSSLRYAGVLSSYDYLNDEKTSFPSSTSIPSGTWRCMGFSSTSSRNTEEGGYILGGVTLWLRIA